MTGLALHLFEHKDLVTCGVPNRNSDCFPCYTGIREMQEAEGIIEKGATLWDYGVTGESGVNLPFRVSAESGWMPPYPAINLSGVKFSKTYEGMDETYKQLMNLPIPVAEDGLPGIRLERDKVPVLLEPGTSCYPRNYPKIIRRETRRSKLQLEADRDCDFVGRAADL